MTPKELQALLRDRGIERHVFTVIRWCREQKIRGAVKPGDGVWHIPDAAGRQFVNSLVQEETIIASA